MQRHFCYIGSVEQLLDFLQAEGLDEKVKVVRYPGHAKINNGELFITGHAAQQIPAVVLRHEVSPEAQHAFNVLRKKFAEKEKTVILHYLGPNYVW